MATIKAKLRLSTIEGKEGTVYYQVIHRNVIRQIKSNFTLHSCEWDAEKGTVVIDHSLYKRAPKLSLIKEQIQYDIIKLQQLEQKLKATGKKYHCDDLVEEYQKQPKGQTFINFFKAQITRLGELDKKGTAYNYTSAMRSFLTFRKGEDITLNNISKELIEEYEVFLKRKGVSLNSSSFYMRILRSVYNKAVDKDLVEQNKPFRSVYTGIEKTIKRSLSLNDIKEIKDFKLHDSPACDRARDLFMFSFYTRGMSFIDILHLKKSNIKNGILSYRRQKTGQLLHVKWEECMQEIVNRYYEEESIYLFPILDNIIGKPNELYLYKREQLKINNWLKKIAVKLNIKIPLTMYVARHSWASAAYRKNIPLSIISESMGHGNESTTQIYLATLDTSAIDSANSLIISSL